jgi:hypothetical protein
LCPQCGKEFRDGNAIKKHREVCASLSGKSIFSCHICEIEYETAHHLNGHYAQHYKQELKEKLTNTNPG